MVAETMNRHSKRFCPLRMVFCSLGCGDEVRERDREMHETVECIRRTQR